MTVKELIEKLEQLDGDTEVVVTKNGYASEINKIMNGKVSSNWKPDIYPVIVVTLGDRVGVTL